MTRFLTRRRRRLLYIILVTEILPWAAVFGSVVGIYALR